MSSIASLGRMVSGLNASQRGLQVTSHNITNANTPGYIRQELLQHESQYNNIGDNSKSLQVGTGVTIHEIRQIRDQFADQRFRTENSILSYYTTKKDAIDEMEVIFGEPHGEALSKTLNDFWGQTQKLASNPAGIEERMAFIQSADVFVKQTSHIKDQLTNYQYNLDTQVRDTVKRFNHLTKDIQSLSETIAYYEMGGDKANDLRDQRNLLVDELSGIMDIQYREDKSGRMVISTEGITILESQFRTEMTVAQTEAESPFVKPVWEHGGGDVYKMNREATSTGGRDNGKLRSLLMMRGNSLADADTQWEDIAINKNLSADSHGNAYLIPKVKKEFDTFVKTLSETINKVFNPDDNKPSGQGIHANVKGTELFVKINKNLEIGAGNIQINPKLLEGGGYNYLPTSATGDESDTQVIKKLLEEWNVDRDWHGGDEITSPLKKITSFRGFYSDLITELGAEGSEARSRAEEKVILVTDIENTKLSMGSVSSDEEMASMMKYQYAYNAAARMITVLDGMMDTVINRM